jgi:hypothetical protein
MCDVVSRILQNFGVPKLQYHNLQNHIFATLLSNLTFGCLILILLTWRIWQASNNASRWQMGFNSAFKGLMVCSKNLNPVPI